MTEHWPVSGPPLEELAGMVADLVAEVNAILNNDRWVLWSTASSTNVRIHQAGILRHACALLEDLASAVAKGREASLRVLGRAHLESWLIGMYLVLGGEDALTDIASGYQHSIETQRARLLAYNAAGKREVTKARRRNRQIKRRNAGVAAWNEAHPEAIKPLLDLVPVPAKSLVDFDLSPALGNYDTDQVEFSPLVLAGVIGRLNEMASLQEGEKTSFDMSYDLAYRGLSTLGAHPTLWVINSYLDFGDRSLMVRTSEAMLATSMAYPVFSIALMQTAFLSHRVLGSKNPTPVADAILNRYHLTSGNSEPM